MTKEAYVQVAPNSTGAKIRNIKSYVVNDDGSETEVYMQVTALVGPNGKLVDPDTSRMQVLLESIDDHLADLVSLMQEVTAQDLKQAIATKDGRFFSFANKEK